MREFNPGDNVDHYRIESLVASGGMATIFKAIDLNDGKQVALKVPHFEAESDPVFFDRFHREIEIGKKLNHPAIAKVFPEERHSRLYMATEWAEGRQLRYVLSTEKTLAPDRAVWIAMELCVALEYMHGQGVVHRDLKPENIIVGDSDRVKIIDFGVASNLGSRRLTFGKLSQVMGSPDYISPEQVKGRRGDGRSDLYALGVILYEMITGQAPFSGPNALAVMNARLVCDPAPPRSINPAVSPQLQEILWKALARDPETRYSTAMELAWDLSHQDQVVPGAHEAAKAKQNKKNRTNWFSRFLHLEKDPQLD